jgi:hypothetical protein
MEVCARCCFILIIIYLSSRSEAPREFSEFKCVCLGISLETQWSKSRQQQVYTHDFALFEEQSNYFFGHENLETWLPRRIA